MLKVLLGVGAVVLLVGGVLFVMNADDSEKVRMMAEQAEMEEKAMMEKAEMEKAAMAKDEMMEKDDMAKNEMMEKDDMAKDEMMKDEAGMETGDSAMADDEMDKAAGMYAPYETSKLAMAKEGDVVLFFKASWCPSCRAADADIKESLSDIPAGVTILEVDYDSSTDLKQKYGVVTQHTFVQVDAAGNELQQWSGGSTLESIVAKIQ